MKTSSIFSDFLREIALYVIVIGSFARSAETAESNIDCYLRLLPLDKWDCERPCNSYMPKILDIIKKYGYETKSVLIERISIPIQNDVPQMVEITSFYRIPCISTVFKREIFGVDLLCAVDNKNADLDNCYDYVDWNEEACDNEIRYPLPSYAAL